MKTTSENIKNIPTVPLWKFLKHSLEIVKNPLPFHRNNFEKLGDTFRLKIGFNKSVVFSRDPGFLQYVLQKNHKNFTKSEIQTRDLAKYVGKGLLSAEGEHWKTQRKLIQPAFHKKQLLQLLDTMQQTITKELNSIKTDTPIEIALVFSDLAFQVVAKSLFSGGITQEQINRLQYITEAAQKMMVRELRQPYLIGWFRLSGILQKHLDLTQEARTILKTLVKNRKETRPQGDLLDMLLDSRYEDGTSMEEEQLIDEMLILFTAGHETTSNALTFTTQLLARNPIYQKKLFEEFNSTEPLGNDYMAVLKNCPITQNVIEESMRLYPPAYFIDRLNKEDDSFNGMQFKKGTMLLFAVHEVHKTPSFWVNPLIFRPERFSEMLPKEYAPYYFPFGAGPRMCIGNNFAIYEMVLAVRTLISNFEIEHKTDPIEINPLITLKPKNPILVFKSRKD